MGIILTIIIMSITAIAITIGLDSYDNGNRLLGLLAKILDNISTLFICMEIWILFQGPGRLDKSWPLLPWPETGQGLASRWSGRSCGQAFQDVDVGLWRLL